MSIHSRFLPLAMILGATVTLSGCDLLGLGDISCDGSPQIEVGESINGTLQSGDGQDVDGAWLDAYILPIDTEGTSVTIDMTSSEVDAWLYLLEEDGSVVDVDDDGGSGLNARITQTLARGCYTIEATTFSPGDVGAYTLSVSG